MSVHKDLTGADLHEPKGADTATAGKVYVSDGAGSGVWTTASDIVTNTAFTTGDLKPTHKVTADTSWIMWSDGTIGDGSSSASIRANADTDDLFALYWDNYSNTLCPVYTSAGAVSTRGASAAADFAAHKRIAVPVGLGRALGIAGAGSGLTSRTVGSTVGAETITISKANLPNVNFVVASGQTVSVNGTLSRAAGNHAAGSTGLSIAADALESLSMTSTGTVTSAGTAASGGSGTAKDIMNPTTYVNVMIKL
jgi:microcystin-dependent protein